MDPILLIINYVFKEKSPYTCSEKLISSFFNNGKSFPLFVQTILRKKIPNFISEPSSQIQIKNNNDLALQSVFQKSKYIEDKNPNWSTSKGQIQLLKLLLTKLCFRLDKIRLLIYCQNIIEKITDEYVTFKNVCSVHYITIILHYLTKGLVKIDANNEFNQTFIDNFKIAKVPLVINEKSFTKKHQYQVVIQLLIIAESYKDDEKYRLINNIYKFEEEENSDSSDSAPSYKEFSENSSESKEEEEDNSTEKNSVDFESNLDDIFLKIINKIGEKGGFEFDNLEQIIENDSLPKYVMYFLNIDSIPNVNLSNNNKYENIDAVLNFLKTKENKFSIILLDFKNPKTVKHSIRAFFVNFLNFFFVKNNNHELENRLDNFEFTKGFSTTEKILSLLHFIIYKNKNFDFENIECKEDITDDLLKQYFDKTIIPKIINAEVVDSYILSGSYFDPLEYQLRFILNSIDSFYKSIYIAEKFFVAIKELKKIELPRFDAIVASLKAKNASIKFQNLRNSQVIHSNNNDDENQSKFDKNNKISEPKTFKKRLNKSKIHHKGKDDKVEEEEIEYVSPTKFWNPLNPNYNFDDKVLINLKYDRKRAFLNIRKQMKEIQNIFKPDPTESSSSSSSDNENDDDDDKINSVLKPYKIFYYDCITQNWVFNSYVLEELADHSGIKKDNIKTPLIFISTSDDDLLVSYFLNAEFPEIDNHLCVYGFCHKDLSNLDLNEDSLISPIFLIVNVPYSQYKSPKIRTIITQIYSFLFSICDIEIFLINQKYYESQVELMKTINNITNYLNQKVKTNSDLNSEQESFECGSDIYFKKYSEKNYKCSEEEDRWEKRNDSDYSDDFNDDDVLEKIHYNNNSKIIYLFESNKFKYDERFDQYIPQNNFFANLISQMGKKGKIHFIDMYDFKTYKLFINSLNEILLDCSTKFEIIKNNFECIKMFNFCGAYIQIKSDLSTWKNELKNLFYQRYCMMKSYWKKDGLYSLLFKLKKEIKEYFPISYDMSLSNEWNSVFLDFKKDILNTNRKIYTSELKKSAKSHLKFIDQSIHSKFYWNEEQIYIIKKSHTSFLKEEFFDILHILNFGKFLDFAYEENNDIVEKQIKKDSMKLDKMFSEFVNKIKIRKTAMEQDAKIGFQKGSNYSMKETENLREIKVAFEIGQNLKSIIEQDF